MLKRYEQGAFKIKAVQELLRFPGKYFNQFEIRCNFGHPSESFLIKVHRNSKVTFDDV